MKKAIILMTMLVSLSCITPLLITSHNSDVIIDKNGDKISLRQKAIKNAGEISSTANIESTNVDYDLRYIYGGNENYQKFNIWELIPTEDEVKDTSYKFLCAKPVGKNLYLYVYDHNDFNQEIDKASFKVSKSKKQTNGQFEEEYIDYNARFINSYGYKQRFMKFAIDNIIDTVNEDIRIYIKNGIITYKNPTTYKSLSVIEDEICFNGNNEDFIYKYYKNDYVKITSGEVALLLTNPAAGSSYQYTEDFYYFFSTDHNIEDLLEVQYDYQLVTYSAEMEVNSNDSIIQSTTCYSGLLNGEKGFTKYESKPRKITEVSQKNKTNNLVNKTTIVQDVTRPYFLWWTQDVTYNFESIQDCLNTSNLVGDEYKGFKDFIDRIQTKKISNGEDKYQWVFKVASSERKVTKSWGEDDWYYYLTFGLAGQHKYTLSECHEVLQTLITWLKFRTNNITFEFNALDIPKDTTSVSLQNIPFQTLTDVVIESIVNGFNNTSSSLILIVIAIVVIILLINLIPAIIKKLKERS